MQLVKKGIIDKVLAIHNSILVVGQNVVVCPTEIDQETDRRNKYLLGLNIGKIVAINEQIEQVQLWWYFGKKWNDDSWILWIDPKTNNPYKQWISADHLAVDDFGRIVRVKMEQSTRRRRRQSHFKLCPESLKTIALCVQLYKDILPETSVYREEPIEIDDE